MFVVQFSDVSGVEMALQADEIKVNERQVRISRAVKQNKLEKGGPDRHTQLTAVATIRLVQPETFVAVQTA